MERPFEALRRSVAEAYGVRPLDLLMRSRRKRIAQPRQALYALASEVLGMSYPQIGRLCNRDHTTVLHGHNAHMIRLDRNENERALTREIIQRYAERMQVRAA